ncbi:hypothetical protein FOZ63_001622 [Perkinsus olseni]|uniref:Uncharacterized protein n=1 Tax=Perkinsus olseni TaxID=32597 RepID=A0A7J6QSK1_PEROL|nr:hypothetical protein FOZ63_001622 [Perkinsus olseni]
MPPKKTLDQKKDRSAIFAWVEWAVDDEGEDLYKCSVCTKGVWNDYRRFSGNTQKSDDKHHRESLLQAEGKAQMKAYWDGISASAQAGSENGSGEEPAVQGSSVACTWSAVSIVIPQPSLAGKWLDRAPPCTGSVGPTK